ncbi:MAG: GldG family protein [Oscillospiraceae bacterium]|nr:GldG family protein [Oscillospiraceae bacterium]
MNRHKIISALYTALIGAFVLAGLILLGAVAEIWTNKNLIKLDATHSGLYTLSEQTVSVLEDMSGDVDICILSDYARWQEFAYYRVISEILFRCQAVSNGRILIYFAEHREYQNDPAFAHLEDLREDEILIFNQQRAVRLHVNDMLVFGAEGDGHSLPIALKAEAVLTDSIEDVLSSDEESFSPRLSSAMTLPKPLGQHSIEISRERETGLLIVLCAVLPLIILMIGFVVYMSRRKLF